MTNLEQLREELEIRITHEHQFDSESYILALNDACYASTLAEIALEEWIQSWLSADEINFSIEDAEYLDGVHFVNDQWNIIIKEKEDAQ